MIYFRKRSRLAKHKASEATKKREHGKACPLCNSAVKLIESGKDRGTFVCTSCKEVVVFTIAPPKQNPMPGEKKLNRITLRDKSPKKYVHTSKQLDYAVSSQSEKTVAVIREGMQDKIVLSFDYVSADNTCSFRNVEPYKLTMRNGAVVLYAHDLEVDKIRVFKVENIGSIDKQEFSFDPRWDVEDKLKKEDDGQSRPTNVLPEGKEE